MATCPSCGGEITWAETEDGERVPVERHQVETSGPRRYRIVSATADKVVVAKVSDDSPLQAIVDHRRDCPGYDNGLRT